MQGIISPEVVLDTIIDRRRLKIFKKVEWPGKASSYNIQHITELIHLVKLANLIRQDRSSKTVLLKLNKKEMEVIQYLADKASDRPEFNVYVYDLNDEDKRKQMYYEWDKYYCSSDTNASMFYTTHDKLVLQEDHQEQAPESVHTASVDTSQIGEEGEMIVFKREKARVQAFNQRLANKVIYFGKQRGIGYDISSIKAVPGPTAEHAIYIEVKTTKRVTRPQSPIKDQFDLTRNEWVAAEQHKANYFIYRVYISNEGISVFVINDPVTKREHGHLYAEPLRYHVEFDDRAGKLDSWD